MIKRRDKRIATLEKEKEDLIEVLREKKVNYENAITKLREIRAELNTFKAHYSTAEDMLKKEEELAANIGKLTVEMEKMKQQGITMDMVEKAAFDILSWFVKDEDNHGSSSSSMFAMTQHHALALMITTRLVERVKYYIKKR